MMHRAVQHQKRILKITGVRFYYKDLHKLSSVFFTNHL